MELSSLLQLRFSDKVKAGIYEDLEIDFTDMKRLVDEK